MDRPLQGNRLYYVLVLLPFAIVSGPLGWNPSVVFSLCCIAVLPLAGLLGEATEQVLQSRLECNA